jgi:hypothetical protein
VVQLRRASMKERVSRPREDRTKQQVPDGKDDFSRKRSWACMPAFEMRMAPGYVPDVHNTAVSLLGEIWPCACQDKLSPAQRRGRRCS